MSISTLLFTLGVAFAVCSLMIRLVEPMASAMGLVDVPHGRKQHASATPQIGGLCIAATLILTCSIWWFANELSLYPWLSFVVLSILLTLLGAYDDRFDISSRIRFFLEALVALAMIYFAGVIIFSVGDLTGSGATLFALPFAIIFTVFSVIGAINSINMIDGVDGLSGTLITMTLATLLGISVANNLTETATILAFLVGATTAFLAVNLRIGRSQAKVFMGDAGCILLGFAMAWFFIDLSQGADAPLSPVSAGWILGLPLMDTISVMVRRLLKGSSPFTADRDHFHHQLLAAGYSVNKTVLTMALIHAVFIAIALIGNHNRSLESLLFWSFVLLTVLHHFLTPAIIERAMRSSLTDCVSKSS